MPVETADLSTTLRSGRDDKLVATLRLYEEVGRCAPVIPLDLSSRPECGDQLVLSELERRGQLASQSWNAAANLLLEPERSDQFVISTGAQRSGEICGFPPAI